MKIELNGLMAAVFTPFGGDGRLNLSVVDDYARLLAGRGVSGVLACGTTGQFASLTVAERRQTAEAFAAAGKGRLRVAVHVGDESLDVACELAAHAEGLGVDAIAALPPSYFKPPDLEAVVDWLARISAAAPRTPLFYYHAPTMTGVSLSVAALLILAAGRVPTLAGVKYTFKELDEYAVCVDRFGDRMAILYGRDEMLLSALVLGAPGAVGSSYNFASPLYRRICDAFDSGDLGAARTDQVRAVRLINTLKGYGYPAASKHCMKLLGVDCGRPRPPFRPLTDEQEGALAAGLQAMGFFQW